MKFLLYVFCIVVYSMAKGDEMYIRRGKEHFFHELNFLLASEEKRKYASDTISHISFINQISLEIIYIPRKFNLEKKVKDWMMNQEEDFHDKFFE